jgi:hypothetical protein
VSKLAFWAAANCSGVSRVMVYAPGSRSVCADRIGLVARRSQIVSPDRDVLCIAAMVPILGWC